jgi:hypothetical protein
LSKSKTARQGIEQIGENGGNGGNGGNAGNGDYENEGEGREGREGRKEDRVRSHMNIPIPCAPDSRRPRGELHRLPGWHCEARVALRPGSRRLQPLRMLPLGANVVPGYLLHTAIREYDILSMRKAYVPGANRIRASVDKATGKLHCPPTLRPRTSPISSYFYPTLL